MITPTTPLIYWNVLGRQLKIWNHLRVRDNYAHKILKLWLGYEFTDLMDECGRFNKYSFNEIRRRLGYKSSQMMLLDIKRTRSFYLLGDSNDEIFAIFSPIWHSYDKSDGKLLDGSLFISESQNESQNVTVLKENNNNKNNNIYNPNGVTAEAVSFDEGSDQRDVFARRNIIRNYFTWLTQQTDLDHKTLVEDIRYHLQHAIGKNGKVMKEYSIRDEEVSDAYKLFVEKFMIPYFSRRQDFFKPDYMSHPEKRIYWLRNFFKRSMSGYGTKVRYLIFQKRKEDEQRMFRDAFRKLQTN